MLIMRDEIEECPSFVCVVCRCIDMVSYIEGSLVYIDCTCPFKNHGAVKHVKLTQTLSDSNPPDYTWYTLTWGTSHITPELNGGIYTLS